MLRSVGNVIRVTGFRRSFNFLNSRDPAVSTCMLRFYANKGDSEGKPPGTTLTPDECTVKRKGLPRTTSSGLGRTKPDGNIPQPATKQVASSGSCKESEMNKLPPPSGPWGEPKKQRKYTTPLIIGAIMAALSAFAFYKYGLDSTKKETPEEEDKKKKVKTSPLRFPADSSEIPSSVPYLLIGGGTASFSAFRAIKSNDPTAKVLVITNESHYPYMRPPLSKEAWFYDGDRETDNIMFKQWNGTERSVYYEPQDFYVECKDLMDQETGGVAVARGWKVDRIDVSEKKAYLCDGYSINYGKCLIATGSKPKTLKVFEEAPEAVKEKVMVYRNLQDFQNLDSLIKSSSSQVVIVGGGFLGSELACALSRLGKNQGFEVTQIFRESGNMGRVLPEYLSNWTSEKVRAEGVNLVTNSEVVGATMKGGSVALHLNTGNEITADQIILCVGAEPSTDLAEKSDLELDPEIGGYAVNAELMARSNLWIAGDCASFHDIRLGRRRVEHHDHAVVTGRLAGENMTGAGKAYTHQSMFWSDLGPDVGYEAIGVVDAKLPTVGVFCKGSEKDTPLGAVSQTDKADRAESEAEAEPVTPATYVPPQTKDRESFNKGIVFYLRDDIIVGILLWNLFNRMSIARQVLKSGKHYEDMNEVAKLFNIHDES